MGKHDRPAFFALYVLGLGAAVTEPSALVAHQLRASENGTESTWRTVPRREDHAPSLVDKTQVVAPSLGASLGTPSTTTEQIRQTGTSATHIGDPAVVTDGMNYLGGIISIIDDDYPYQCVCKSSRHYLSKMFSSHLPHDVEITSEVRGVLEEWLSKSNHGTTNYQAGDEAEQAAFETRRKQAETALWGAGGASLVEGTTAAKAVKPAPPHASSFVQLSVHAAMHRAGVQLLSGLFARSNPDLEANNRRYYDPAYMSKQYNDYNYEYRDGYCEKDTKMPCFPIPGGASALGLLLAAVVGLF
jgi:hypothetical protein